MRRLIEKNSSARRGTPLPLGGFVPASFAYLELSLSYGGAYIERGILRCVNIAGGMDRQ